MSFQRVPILDTARRCGLVLDNRTLRRTEVEAACPFCGDHGPGKYHLSLNTNRDVYRCNLCSTSGNSVTLYARLRGVTNQEAFRDLTGGSNVYQFPARPVPQYTERQPAKLEERHAVYSETLSFLTLSDKHRASLLRRCIRMENRWDFQPMALCGMSGLYLCLPQKRRLTIFRSASFDFQAFISLPPASGTRPE